MRCASPFHMCHFFKHCSILMRYLQSTKTTVFQKRSPVGVSGWFVSNLVQNFNVLYLMICQYFFKTLYLHGAQYIENSIVSQFSQEIIFSNKRIIWAQFGPKLFNLISYDLSQSCFETFWHDGANRLKKVALVNFP